MSHAHTIVRQENDDGIFADVKILEFLENTSYIGIHSCYCGEISLKGLMTSFRTYIPSAPGMGRFYRYGFKGTIAVGIEDICGMIVPIPGGVRRCIMKAQTEWLLSPGVLLNKINGFVCEVVSNILSFVYEFRRVFKDMIVDVVIAAERMGKPV